jgi:hypothetical protein
MNALIALPVAFALLSAGDPAPSVSNTSVSAASPKILLDPCRTAAADASATLGANEDAELLSSSGTGYSGSARACKRFIADFKVTADANPADSHGTLDFGLAGGLKTDPTQATCAATELFVTTYEKVAGSSNFTQRTSAKYKGQWASGMFSSCNLVRVSGTNPPSDQPNPAGAETWRVAVRATVNGAAVPVQARIAFDIVPW